MSVDGCGAPVFALPLAAMATAYARLAAPEGFVDDDTAKAARTIGSSMQAKPLFVSGTGRICTALMEALAPAVVAKGGAEGVYCVGLPAKGWGIAIKVQDGAARATGPVIVELLTALGIVHRGAGEALEEHRRPAVRNLSGLTVGRIQAALPAGFKDQLRRLGEVA